MRRACLLAMATVMLVSTAAWADLVLSGTTTVKAQGFGNIYNVLTLHDQNTETGAVAPSNANTTTGYTGGTAITSFGTCGSGGPPLGNATECGAIANTSTIQDLADLGLQNASEFGVLLNNAQNSSEFLVPNPQGGVIFEVNLYNADGSVAATFACLTSTCNYPATGLAPAGQGQGGAGYLFTLTSTEQAELNMILCGSATCGSSALAAGTIFVGGAGSFTNANGGPDDISIARITGPITTTPEPASLALFGGGFLALAGLLRRRK
jgi:hypothetical protein